MEPRREPVGVGGDEEVAEWAAEEVPVADEVGGPLAGVGHALVGVEDEEDVGDGPGEEPERRAPVEPGGEGEAVGLGGVRVVHDGGRVRAGARRKIPAGPVRLAGAAASGGEGP